MKLKKITIDSIQIQLNPIKDSIDELFQEMDTINLLGIHSNL